jgi:putative heme-binding domain-containing protein
MRRAFPSRVWAFYLAATLSGFFASAMASPAAGEAQADDQSRKTRSAMPAARIKPLAGFRVDLLYTVPRETQGSWVNMTTDPKGRLIVSDQYGKLYRVALPALDAAPESIKVEAIPVDIGEAHGLLWAFDSLYVVVNRGKKYDSGLYRVRDTNGDDQLDTVELLRKIEGGGEHGPHAVLLAPDGQSLYFIAGNATRLPRLDGSLVQLVWGEDNLLPRMVDGSGFMTDEKAPGGYICRVSPDGQTWTLVSMGYRNPFDMAFNHAGELFTYDSDMEWDVNTPWYRPTRVLHATSGSEFGYRNGSGKWPPYYIDSLPPVVNIGPGSPTGVTFGYGAKFPAKYQEAFYICDWSYGKLYAVHLRPEGASYTAEIEEFLAGTPLALTDAVVNPADGALYFAVGGRNTQSGLYRVTYSGPESTAPIDATASDAGTEARALRHKLESFHGHADPEAIDTAWPYLGHADRFIRWAARVAIQAQDVSQWRDRALAEKSSPEAALNALLALVQVSASDRAHRAQDQPEPDPALGATILAALDAIDLSTLTVPQRLDLLRVYQVALNRFGRPNEATARRLIASLDPHYPANTPELNTELIQILAYLQASTAVAKTVALLQKAPTQEEQIEYARALRVLTTEWTPVLHDAYARWFRKAAAYKGGNSFRGFIRNIRRDAAKDLSDEEKARFDSLADAKPESTAEPAFSERAFVKAWTVDELVPLVDAGLKNRDYDRGRALFAATKCFSCHRFNNEGGGLGPDLSGIAGRFGTRDMLESIVEPSKTISDQYQAVTIASSDGRVITGRIVNLNNDGLMINTDMLDPNLMVNIKRDQIEEMTPSTTSMMPQDLLNTLDRDEVLDLMAYLLSRGDRGHTAFRN